MYSTSMPITNIVLQGSVMEHVLFNIFFSVGEEVTEYTLVKFAGNAKLEDLLICSRAGLSFRDTQTVWRNRLTGNMKFKKEKCKFLFLES